MKRFGSTALSRLRNNMASKPSRQIDANDAGLSSNEFAQLRRILFFRFTIARCCKLPLLTIPRYGALNMHGSLLPKYRGRVPVNWAVIRGETETGATLHYMVEKPDAGDIVGQQAVPIGPDDTAFDVFGKVTECRGVSTRCYALPSLLRGERTGTSARLEPRQLLRRPQTRRRAH